MSTIAIITARGGSKRIPRKNIKNFCGQPIIAYSIRAAIDSGIFDHVMVSTDDEEIAEIARKYGAEVPFMRSAETANDFATTRDVLEEVIRKYDEIGENIDYFCCIYPCAPFVTAKKLRDCFDYLRQKDAHAVWPVVKFSPPPQRCFELVDGMIKYKYPEYKNMRSQDIEPLYHDCGQFYFYNKKAFEKGDAHVFERIFPIFVPETEVQDVDDETDWKIAEMKYKLMIEK